MQTELDSARRLLLLWFASRERPATIERALYDELNAAAGVIAFTELFSAPTSRHVIAITLATFIDLIVFLLAYASGPFFFGAPAERWLKAGAALDSKDKQVFARDLLRKVSASEQGLARVEAMALSHGERQLVLLLASQGLAAPVEEDGQLFYLLDASVLSAFVRGREEPLVGGLQLDP